MKRRPNIVYVFADQWRQSALGGMPGGDPVLTPRLDRFVQEGLDLRQAASTFPLCSPHRAMLLSGRYPHKNTVVHNINSRLERDFQLQDSQICVTDVFSQGGYHVGYIGKWHLTRPHEPYLEEFRHKNGLVWNEFTPPESRHSIDYWYGYNTHDQHLNPMYWDSNDGRQNYKFVDEWGPDHETEKAIRYLERRQPEDDPFALFLSYNPPHPPFDQVPQEYLDIYRGATPEELLTRGNVRDENGKIPESAIRGVYGYYAMISGVDAAFGRLLDAIDRLGLREDTIIVFTSDHGEMMGSHDRMGKVVWYDESYRVPFYVRWPEKIKAGSSSDLLIDTPDIPATLVGMAGLEDQIPSEWQGRNFATQLKTGSSHGFPEGQLYRHDPAKLRGIRTQRYTLVTAVPMGPRSDNRVLDGPILYDNQEDPWQLVDVAKDRPKVVDELCSLLLDSCRRVDDSWSA